MSAVTLAAEAKRHERAVWQSFELTHLAKLRGKRRKMVRIGRRSEQTISYA
jgi:hypothetical protein